ncbi:MAG TPA: DUF3368 domain-containing protein [Candidatus Hydrogenedentes bacterium]|nr:DUF3368 domain-containing protein [Candidatus Hydrogenedentota bacterium]HNT87681.1 DUF3368 domain-containing protein [Candidatus Hydrogenedentota bacterium]
MPDCIVNASPLIALGLVGRIGLLERLFDSVVVPQGVVEEISAGDKDDAARCWLEGEGRRWTVRSISVHPVIAGWDLGKGESEVLSWGYTLKGHVLILDDGAARKCARSLGMACRGTLGLLVSAKQQGLLDAVTPILHALESAGIWMRPELIATVKRLAGE